MKDLELIKRVPDEDFHYILPCNCEDCEGFAMVSNNKMSIKAHNKLYN